MLRFSQIHNRIPTAAKLQSSPDTNDKPKSTEMLAGLVDELLSGLTNALPAVNTSQGSNLESEHSYHGSGNMVVPLHSDSLTDRSDALESLKDQANSPRNRDRASASGGLAQLNKIVAALNAARSLLNNDDTSLSSLNLRIQLVGQNHLLGGDDNSNLPVRLLCLSQLLLKRATILDSASDLDGAMECLRRAAQDTKEDLILRVLVLKSLALAHKRRFMRYGSPTDINAAIEYQYQTITCAGDKHEQYAILTAELGSLLKQRHGVLGGLDDLQKSIECQTWALTFVSENGDNRTMLLNNLGNAHLCLFDRLGELEDVNRAIKCLIEAIEHTSEGHPHMPAQFTNLGGSYLRRFERLGDLEDISRSI
ncbi:hypothetical protein BDV93DRAFT_560768, partial [Ceratobasidium sp. AG-I]